MSSSLATPDSRTAPALPEQAPFSVTFATDRLQRRALAGDLYSTALAYIRGEVEISGDLFAAIRHFTSLPRTGWTRSLHALLGRSGAWRFESWRQTRARAARNIRLHYDLGSDFYRLFLDQRMVYSCAYFRDPDSSLDQAQLAKLNHICRKLALRPGERFLDIGCGWGGLLEHAADEWGAVAAGCTLSREQFRFAADRLGSRARILELDYRDVPGRYDKIASVGMFEHVGRRRLPGYFRRVCSLLSGEGLFLNHGIVRPHTMEESAESFFLRRHVFPGVELPHLADLIRDAELGGFEILDVENLRPHYALTTRAWVEGLLRNSDQCAALVGPRIYRTWLLYLAACSVQFERGELDVYQVLLAKRSHPSPRRLTRDYMYGGPAGLFPG